MVLRHEHATAFKINHLPHSSITISGPLHIEIWWGFCSCRSIYYTSFSLSLSLSHSTGIAEYLRFFCDELALSFGIHYMYKSPSLSSIHFPCSYSFAGSPPAHPFFIRINEKFHVSWSFNIITGTFKAFSVMLCTHLQSLSVDIYIFCLIHRHSGHWLCDYGHSLYKTPHTHIQSNSRRRIVRQIYYAHKFSTSFVFSIGKCEWQFR